MTAPSITTPHVRSGGTSMTQSKSYSHGRICIKLLHSSTGLSPLLPLFRIFSNAPLFILMPLFRSASPPPPPFFHLHFFHLTIEMSSLSSLEQGITSQVVWFKPAVHSSCPSNERLLKKKCMALVLISNYALSLLSLWLFSLHYNSFHLSNMLSRGPFPCSNCY